jgi:asparagine synthase (glutamine-hydrolysing)
MCGIAGILTFDNKPVLKEEIKRLTDSIAHRGHDSDKISLGGSDRGRLSTYEGIGLGHRRLSVIDLSEQSAQPMSDDENTFCIVYNGELYNYQEIKQQLIQLGHTFRTESDTEVVLLAYKQWGEDCLLRFNGMFAIAIWNENNQELFCARDQFGIKPFYYKIDNNSFQFASESQALSAGNRTMLNEDAVKSYLFSMYVPRNRSIFEGVSKLLPGTTLTVDRYGKKRIKTYWTVPQSGVLSVSPQDAATQLQYLFDKSVKTQLRSDVPVGALLSGGFDSGMIVASAAQSLNTLHTYSVGFDDGLQFNELDIAKSLSQRYGTLHHQRIIKSDEIITLLDKAIYSMSEPVADSAMVPSYCLSQMAAEDGVKVLLSGTGGDEVFGGYSRYIGYSRVRRMYLAVPERVRKFIGSKILSNSSFGARLKYNSIDMMLSTGGSPALARQLFASEKEFSLFLKQLASDVQPLIQAKQSQLYDYMHFDLQVYLPDLLMFLLDQLTMAHTVEGRVPYLDIDLVTASYNLIPGLHVSSNETRKIQRLMARGKLDDKTFVAKKQGFSGPVKHWINNNKAKFTERVMAAKAIPGLDKLPIEALCSMEEGTGKNAFWHDDMFSLYCFSTWYYGNN